MFSALAKRWRIPAVGLTFADVGERSGFYDPDADVVALHEDVLDEDEPDKALATLVHELRHAVQEAAMKDPDRHPLGSVEGADEIDRWRQADADYHLTRADFTEYAYNALEVDAFDVEKAVLMAYFKRLSKRPARRWWGLR